MKPARLAAEAVVELSEAAAWYESQREGLGEELLREFEVALAAIESRHSAFPRLLGISSDLNVRRALLPRFPYAAVFMELPSEIRILAVAHAKRRPKYWLNRVTSSKRR